MSFSAVILAGGQSSRMGRDKAALELAGETLLARQIRLVQAAGAAEVFISGRAGRDDTKFGCPVLADNFPQAGPLAGIESALQKCCNPLLLVLAVDMPLMSAAVLEELLKKSGVRIGVIPRLAGRAEPLAALYPSLAAPLATELLQPAPASAATGSPGVGFFAARCVREGWARYHDLPADLAPCFKSWNAPQDIISL
jgi:molybdopterin-guanine dinucleotide biosynthesis protein A